MRSLLILLVVVTVFAQDVEDTMTPTEIIAHWGYPAESHDIVTDDGYIITMVRIPHGRYSRGNSSCHRPPVLLVHGILADSSEWILNPPESSPGMILADAGFDVFMLNVRGTRYSQKHVNLTNHDRDFWKYTVDDMAKFDAPAAIDRVLSLNGAKSLYYIGHSQGTMISFLMLAERSEYNRKAYKTNLGPHEIGLNIPWLLTRMGRFLCTPFTGYEMCKDFLFLLAGPPAKTFNWTRMPVYLSHVLISTSTWNTAIRNSVYHFDVSPEENMRRYGQVTAPLYDYSKIDTDVYLFWSRNDWLTSPEEIEKWLIPQMRPGIIKGTFEIADYNHVDYAVATDVGEQVFSKIIALMRRNETNYCIQ